MSNLRVKAFGNILPKPSPANLNYNFSVVWSGDEEFFRNDGQTFKLTSGDFRHVNGTLAPSVYDTFSELILRNLFPFLWKTLNPAGVGMFMSLNPGLGVGDGCLDDDGVALGADDVGFELGAFLGGLNACCCCC
ncbi:hypothetical protein Salat_0715900 [Sesamum alatum]|uniref:Uncharacterized protein n=1 Tax=Sesamum alatum TaxID=300844 RepID=A0AAE1YS76_9LAMI|nr:hypothetical protein Salat_0715900 [Sesamum alatum]